MCETLRCPYGLWLDLPLLDYKVPEFLLERVCVSVEHARQAYLAAEFALLNAPAPNVARELLDYSLNQLEYLKANPIGLCVQAERFALHDPIGRLREFCVRAAARIASGSGRFE